MSSKFPLFNPQDPASYDIICTRCVQARIRLLGEERANLSEEFGSESMTHEKMGDPGVSCKKSWAMNLRRIFAAVCKNPWISPTYENAQSSGNASPDKTSDGIGGTSAARQRGLFRKVSNARSEHISIDSKTIYMDTSVSVAVSSNIR